MALHGQAVWPQSGAGNTSPARSSAQQMTQAPGKKGSAPLAESPSVAALDDSTQHVGPAVPATVNHQLHSLPPPSLLDCMPGISMQHNSRDTCVSSAASMEQQLMLPLQQTLTGGAGGDAASVLVSLAAGSVSSSTPLLTSQQQPQQHWQLSRQPFKPTNLQLLQQQWQHMGLQPTNFSTAALEQISLSQDADGLPAARWAAAASASAAVGDAAVSDAAVHAEQQQQQAAAHPIGRDSSSKISEAPLLGGLGVQQQLQQQQQHCIASCLPASRPVAAAVTGAAPDIWRQLCTTATPTKQAAAASSCVASDTMASCQHALAPAQLRNGSAATAPTAPLQTALAAEQQSNLLSAAHISSTITPAAVGNVSMSASTADAGAVGTTRAAATSEGTAALTSCCSQSLDLQQQQHHSHHQYKDHHHHHHQQLQQSLKPAGPMQHRRLRTARRLHELFGNRTGRNNDSSNGCPRPPAAAAPAAHPQRHEDSLLQQFTYSASNTQQASLAPLSHLHPFSGHTAATQRANIGQQQQQQQQQLLADWLQRQEIAVSNRLSGAFSKACEQYNIGGALAILAAESAAAAATAECTISHNFAFSATRCTPPVASNNTPAAGTIDHAAVACSSAPEAVAQEAQTNLEEPHSIKHGEAQQGSAAKSPNTAADSAVVATAPVTAASGSSATAAGAAAAASPGAACHCLLSPGRYSFRSSHAAHSSPMAADDIFSRQFSGCMLQFGVYDSAEGFMYGIGSGDYGEAFSGVSPSRQPLGLVDIASLQAGSPGAAEQAGLGGERAHSQGPRSMGSLPVLESDPPHESQSAASEGAINTTQPSSNMACSAEAVTPTRLSAQRRAGGSTDAIFRTPKMPAYRSRGSTSQPGMGPVTRKHSSGNSSMPSPWGYRADDGSNVAIAGCLGVIADAEALLMNTGQSLELLAPYSPSSYAAGCFNTPVRGSLRGQLTRNHTGGQLLSPDSNPLSPGMLIHDNPLSRYYPGAFTPATGPAENDKPAEPKGGATASAGGISSMAAGVSRVGTGGDAQGPWSSLLPAPAEALCSWAAGMRSASTGAAADMAAAAAVGGDGSTAAGVHSGAQLLLSLASPIVRKNSRNANGDTTAAAVTAAANPSGLKRLRSKRVNSTELLSTKTAGGQQQVAEQTAVKDPAQAAGAAGAKARLVAAPRQQDSADTVGIGVIRVPVATGSQAAVNTTQAIADTAATDPPSLLAVLKHTFAPSPVRPADLVAGAGKAAECASTPAELARSASGLLALAMPLSASAINCSRQLTSKYSTGSQKQQQQAIGSPLNTTEVGGPAAAAVPCLSPSLQHLCQPLQHQQVAQQQQQSPQQTPASCTPDSTQLMQQHELQPAQQQANASSSCTTVPDATGIQELLVLPVTSHDTAAAADANKVVAAVTEPTSSKPPAGSMAATNDAEETPPATDTFTEPIFGCQPAQPRAATKVNAAKCTATAGRKWARTGQLIAEGGGLGRKYSFMTSGGSLKDEIKDPFEAAAGASKGPDEAATAGGRGGSALTLAGVSNQQEQGLNMTITAGLGCNEWHNTQPPRTQPLPISPPWSFMPLASTTGVKAAVAHVFPQSPVASPPASAKVVTATPASAMAKAPAPAAALDTAMAPAGAALMPPSSTPAAANQKDEASKASDMPFTCKQPQSNVLTAMNPPLAAVAAYHSKMPQKSGMPASGTAMKGQAPATQPPFEETAGAAGKIVRSAAANKAAGWPATPATINRPIGACNPAEKAPAKVATNKAATKTATIEQEAARKAASESATPESSSRGINTNSISAKKAAAKLAALVAAMEAARIDRQAGKAARLHKPAINSRNFGTTSAKVKTRHEPPAAITKAVHTNSTAAKSKRAAMTVAELAGKAAPNPTTPAATRHSMTPHEAAEAAAMVTAGLAARAVFDTAPAASHSSTLVAAGGTSGTAAEVTAAAAAKAAVTTFDASLRTAAAAPLAAAEKPSKQACPATGAAAAALSITPFCAGAAKRTSSPAACQVAAPTTPNTAAAADEPFEFQSYVIDPDCPDALRLRPRRAAARDADNKRRQLEQQAAQLKMQPIGTGGNSSSNKHHRQQQRSAGAVTNETAVNTAAMAAAAGFDGSTAGVGTTAHRKKGMKRPADHRNEKQVKGRSVSKNPAATAAAAATGGKRSVSSVVDRTSNSAPATAARKKPKIAGARSPALPAKHQQQQQKRKQMQGGQQQPSAAAAAGKKVLLSSGKAGSMSVNDSALLQLAEVAAKHAATAAAGRKGEIIKQASRDKTTARAIDKSAQHLSADEGIISDSSTGSGSETESDPESWAVPGATTDDSDGVVSEVDSDISTQQAKRIRPATAAAAEVAGVKPSGVGPVVAAVAAGNGDSDSEGDVAGAAAPRKRVSKSVIQGATSRARGRILGPAAAAVSATGGGGSGSGTAAGGVGSLAGEGDSSLADAAAAAGDAGRPGPNPKGGRPLGAGNKGQMVPRFTDQQGQLKFGCRSTNFTGVYRCKRHTVRWRTQFSYGGKVLNVGSYDTEFDAARAWNAAAVHFRGEGTWLNPVDPLLPEDGGVAVASALPQPPWGSKLLPVISAAAEAAAAGSNGAPADVVANDHAAAAASGAGGGVGEGSGRGSGNNIGGCGRAAGTQSAYEGSGGSTRKFMAE